LHQVFKEIFQNEGSWESEDFVSLDPCSCPPVCPPKGISRLLYWPKREDYGKRQEEKLIRAKEAREEAKADGTIQGRKRRYIILKAWVLSALEPWRPLLYALKVFGSFLLVSFFAVLPAASILVLYVIPTSHERLWAILGESVFLVCALKVWNTWSSEKLDILAYMTG
jgi:hypothetical protein